MANEPETSFYIYSKRTLHQKRRFGTRFRKTVKTKPVLSQNDGKRTLHQERRLGTRFTATVITNPVVTQNDGKRILHQKRRYSEKH